MRDNDNSDNEELTPEAQAYIRKLNNAFKMRLISQARVIAHAKGDGIIQPSHLTEARRAMKRAAHRSSMIRDLAIPLAIGATSIFATLFATELFDAEYTLAFISGMLCFISLAATIVIYTTLKEFI